ncbi:hypothetical protein CROQUDRAFT_400452 [Cronartium quercuum f. sp. fusiforme G11]|uniref:Uncharacterized protein n=1 Tax=Cronartium quercuum f. sp. fusiforme G11 TaxID=708437 RepID=A0A9P6N6C7_9BASI|nr:hypothetical protein CROQUDRAFT_400452 [Cronartium quercuum f. sp. fusiforme G11]
MRTRSQNRTTPKPNPTISSLSESDVRLDMSAGTAKKPDALPHMDSLPYKSIDFYMRMPTMVKNATMTLDPAGTKYISWKE